MKIKKLILTQTLCICISLLWSCTTSSEKTNFKTNYEKQIIDAFNVGTWYLFSPETTGEVIGTLIFEKDGSIGGETKKIFGYEKAEWSIKYITKENQEKYSELGSVWIYNLDSDPEKKEIPGKLEYNRFLAEVKYNNFYNKYKNKIYPFKFNSKEKQIQVLYTNSWELIKEIKQEFQKIKKEYEELENKILSSVDKKNLYILDFSTEKHFEKLNSISRYKDLSFYRLFDEAYFNKKENPNIFNNTDLDDDEFTYREKKSIYKEIRDKKYLFINSDYQNVQFEIEFSEYNFNKKGYYCTIKKIAPVGGLMGSGPFKVIEMISKPFFISMNETEAKEFKKHKINFNILAKRTLQEKTIKVTKVNINEGGIKDIALDEGVWRHYKEQNWMNASRCFISNEKIKQLNLNVIKYYIIDTDTNKTYTNIK